MPCRGAAPGRKLAQKSRGKKKAAPKDSFLSAPDTRTSPGVALSPRRLIPTRCGRFESQWFPHPFLRGRRSHSVSQATCCMVSIVWAHDKDVSLAGIRFAILHPFGPVFAGGQRRVFHAASEEASRNPQSSLKHYPRRASWVGGHALSTEADRSCATGSVRKVRDSIRRDASHHGCPSCPPA